MQFWRTFRALMDGSASGSHDSHLDQLYYECQSHGLGFKSPFFLDSLLCFQVSCHVFSHFHLVSLKSPVSVQSCTSSPITPPQYLVSRFPALMAKCSLTSHATVGLVKSGFWLHSLVYNSSDGTPSDWKQMWS